MREIVGMIFAIVGAVIAFAFLSEPIANWVALQIPVESPDENDNWHDIVFMGVNILGLAAGWFIGWTIAGPLTAGERPK